MDFFKYDGTGNDFIIIDNRTGFFPKDTALISRLCDRRRGIGADGLMLLESETGYDFRMVYYNADGRESTMCGNGGRCISHFAHLLGLVQKDETSFIAIDGSHKAKFISNNVVSLQMTDVNTVKMHNDDYIIQTGSPHYVHFTPDVTESDIVAYGRHIRYSDTYAHEGINVNIVSEEDGHWYMRTYERGVEDETLSCGTGTVATAMAIGIKQKFHDGTHTVMLHAPGGTLNVQYDKLGETFKNVYLTGSVERVFDGKIDITT